LEVSNLTIAREITSFSQQVMKNCITRALSFMNIVDEILQDNELVDNPTCLAPWFLDCIYQTMANLTYLISTTPAVDGSDYILQRNRCSSILQRANRRWKVAGEFFATIYMGIPFL
jgi:hypothetical protein